jgi:hypothetical protein
MMEDDSLPVQKTFVRAWENDSKILGSVGSVLYLVIQNGTTRGANRGRGAKEDEEEISSWRFIHLTAMMFGCMG